MESIKKIKVIVVSALIIVSVSTIFSLPSFMRCTGEVDPNVNQGYLKTITTLSLE